MKQAQMKVLEMLDAGKITAEEAAKLLEAMKGTGGGTHHFVFDDESEKSAEEKLNHFAQGFDNFTKEFGAKVESFYKDVEPKFKKASQTVLEKTAAVVDEISKSLNESLEHARKEPCEDECCCCEEKAEEACCCEENAEDAPCCCEAPDNETPPENDNTPKEN